MAEGAPPSNLDTGEAAARVLIVDDHPIVRKGVRHALDQHGGYCVGGEAGNMTDALELAIQLQPDIVVLDLVLGGRDGPDGVAEMRRALPHAGILVFSMNAEEIYAPLVLEAGANGYLVKSHDFDELFRALGQILAGGTYLSPQMTRTLAAGGHAASDMELLTGREMQVFLRMGEGKTTSEIAYELNLSIKTVFTHRDRIKAKLHARNGAELTRRAMNYVYRHGAHQPAQ